MEPAWLAVILLALAGLSLLAYALGALDAIGASVSFGLGLGIALIGDMGWLGLMVLFSGLGVLATQAGAVRKRELRIMEGGDGERAGQRGWRNVAANGLAPLLAALCLRLGPWVPDEAARLAFATAVAAVCADTLASELGALAPRARRILPPFTVVASGQNGAVSLVGQAAALLGASTIAAAAVLLIGLDAALAPVAALAGFLGCQLDSVLGATLERDLTRDGPLSKQDVNFVSSAVPAFIVLVATALSM